MILTAKILPRPHTAATHRQFPKRTRAAEAAAAAQTAPTEFIEEKPTTETVSILEKLRLEGYKSSRTQTSGDETQFDDSEVLQNLRGDLKLAAQRVIATLSPSSEMYSRIDKFFFYAESLFARCIPSGSAELATQTDAQTVAQDEADPYAIHERGEDKEVLYMVSQHGPLFSSLSRKSRIDPREFEVPSFFNTTKIVPLRPTTTTARRLGMLSPSPYHAVVGSAPGVAARLRPLLSDFTHPVNEKLPTAKWLKYDAYSSFAPTTDQTQTIISGHTAAMVWYERRRRRQALQLEREAGAVNDAVADDNGDEESEEKNDESSEDVREAEGETEKENSDKNEEQPEEKTEEENESVVDPALIADWLASEESKQYDVVTFTAVASWLERLQELQSARFAQAPPSAPLVIPANAYQNPQQMVQMQLQQAQQQQYFIEGAPISDEEHELVRKVQYALSELVSQVPPYLLGDSVSRWIPTLAKSTVGSLPPDASADVTVSHTQSPATGGSGRRRR